MDEVINFRIDKKTKTEAQAIAKKMGLSLSDVLNVLLRQFIRDKSIDTRQQHLSEKVKLAVHVPVSHVDAVRQALGQAGAGKIGNYDLCSFSCPGMGRYRGNKNSNPTIGKAGNYEKTEEERIEVTVPRQILKEVIAKMKEAHPYDQPTFDIYQLEDF